MKSVVKLTKQFLLVISIMNFSFIYAQEINKEVSVEEYVSSLDKYDYQKYIERSDKNFLIRDIGNTGAFLSEIVNMGNRKYSFAYVVYILPDQKNEVIRDLSKRTVYSFEKWKIWEKENEIKRREKAILSNKKLDSLKIVLDNKIEIKDKLQQRFTSKVNSKNGELVFGLALGLLQNMFFKMDNKITTGSIHNGINSRKSKFKGSFTNNYFDWTSGVYDSIINSLGEKDYYSFVESDKNLYPYHKKYIFDKTDIQINDLVKFNLSPHVTNSIELSDLYESGKPIFNYVLDDKASKYISELNNKDSGNNNSLPIPESFKLDLYFGKDILLSNIMINLKNTNGDLSDIKLLINECLQINFTPTISSLFITKKIRDKKTELGKGSIYQLKSQISRYTEAINKQEEELIKLNSSSFNLVAFGYNYGKLYYDNIEDGVFNLCINLEEEIERTFPDSKVEIKFDNGKIDVERSLKAHYYYEFKNKLYTEIRGLEPRFNLSETITNLVMNRVAVKSRFALGVDDWIDLARSDIELEVLKQTKSKLVFIINTSYEENTPEIFKGIGKNRVYYKNAPYLNSVFFEIDLKKLEILTTLSKKTIQMSN